MELIKENDSIVGVKIISTKPYSIGNDVVLGSGKRVGELYHKKEFIIDLHDMDKPVLSSIKTDYAGDSFGYEYGVIKLKDIYIWK